MTIKEFIEMNEKFGYENDLTTDVNVYLNDDESAEFNKLVESMTVKPYFEIKNSCGMYHLSDRCEFICYLDPNSTIDDTYRILTEYMTDVKKLEKTVDEILDKQFKDFDKWVKGEVDSHFGDDYEYFNVDNTKA